jgi:hypothetical protein
VVAVGRERIDTACQAADRSQYPAARVVGSHSRRGGGEAGRHQIHDGQRGGERGVGRGRLWPCNGWDGMGSVPSAVNQKDVVQSVGDNGLGGR